MRSESASRARGWVWGMLWVVLWACGPVPEEEPVAALRESTARVVASCGATCSEGYQYALQCPALRSSSACPLLGYEQTTCYSYRTCAHPDFGLLSRASRTETVSLTGSYQRVLKCESNQLKEVGAGATSRRRPPYFCYWEYEYYYDQSCEERAQALRATLPAPWQAGVTYTHRQGGPSTRGPPLLSPPVRLHLVSVHPVRQRTCALKGGAASIPSPSGRGSG